MSGQTVLYFSLYTELGGGERALLNLLKELDKSRYQPLVVFNRPGPLVDAVQALGVDKMIVSFPVVPLKWLLNPYDLVRVLMASFRIHKAIGSRRIGLIHCGDVLSLFLLWRTAVKRSVPVVYGVIFFYEWMRVVLFNLLALTLVDRIVANSPAVARYMRRWTFFLSDRIETIHPGVDTAVFRPAASGEKNMLREEFRTPHRAKIIGMVARFDRVKGHTTFMKAAGMLLKEDPFLQFVVVGGTLMAGDIEGIEPYHRDIRELHARLEMGDELRFLGDRSDMPELVRSLDVLVCPSVREGFGLVVPEALASGVPVIACRNVGAVELFKDHPLLFVVKPSDAEGLAQKLRDLVYDRVARSAPVPFDPEGKFSWASFARSHESLYKALIQN